MASFTLLVDGADFRSKKVEAVARLVGVSLAVTPAAGASAAQQAAVKASPWGSLPLLLNSESGETVAWRTHGALRFLAALREDAQLAGFDCFTQAEVDQWLDWGFAEVDSLAAFLGGGAAAGGAQLSKEQKAAATAQAKRKLPIALAVLDKHLQSRTWLAGHRLTIADVSIALALQSFWQQEVEKAGLAAGLTNVCRWHSTVLGQPEVQAALTGKAAAPAKKAESLAGAAPAAAAAGGAGAVAHTPAAGGGASHGSSTATLPTALTAFDTSLPSPRFSRYRLRVADLMQEWEKHLGTSAIVCGWARTVREAGAGKLAFIALNDGSSFDSLQVVAEQGKTAGFECIAKSGGTHACFKVTGLIVKSPAKGQPVELQATEVELLGEVQEANSYPMAKKKHTLEHLREVLHLRPRTNTIGAVARIRNACAYATHKFFQDRGFLYVHTPIITGSDCEGAGEMFQVTTILPDNPKELHKLPKTKEGAIDYKKDFFGKPTMLTVSGQLQVEAYACAMSDVYTFGPTFRAENSHTSRHLAEFWMIEPEMCFATLKEDMALAEDYLKFCTQFVLEHCSKDLDFFESTFEKGLRDRLQNVVREPFQVLDYTDAITLLTTPEHLAKGKFEVKPYWGLDLASEHERYLTERVFCKPVILINYPKDIKAFYMKLNPDGKTVACMDILVPKVGEIIGGSQREDNLATLQARMADMGVGEESLKWYLDLRKYGSVPHAGFGLGFERLVMFLTGIENIRDAIPFPRFPGNASL